MSLSYNLWKKLFLFCLGLTIASAFCMKWMESDLWFNNDKITIMGLELFYSKEKVLTILAGLDGHVKTLLGYHLRFDFVFMAGVYPGITAMCMMAREKITSGFLGKLLFLFAFAQLLAWAADITENSYLLYWIRHPDYSSDINLYHFIVASKWIIALIGVLLSVPVLLLKLKIKMK